MKSIQRILLGIGICIFFNAHSQGPDTESLALAAQTAACERKGEAPSPPAKNLYELRAPIAYKAGDGLYPDIKSPAPYFSKFQYPEGALNREKVAVSVQLSEGGLHPSSTLHGHFTRRKLPFVFDEFPPTIDSRVLRMGFLTPELSKAEFTGQANPIYFRWENNEMRSPFDPVSQQAIALIWPLESIRSTHSMDALLKENMPKSALLPMGILTFSDAEGPKSYNLILVPFWIYESPAFQNFLRKKLSSAQAPPKLRLGEELRKILGDEK